MPTPQASEDVAFGRIDEVLFTAAATVEILLNTREATNALNFADRLWSLYLEPGWLEVLGANEHDFGVSFHVLRSFAAARAARSTEPVSAFRTSAPSYAALALTFAEDVDRFVRYALADVNGLISSIADTVERDAGASAAAVDESRIIAALDAHLANKRTRRFMEKTLAQARVDAARLFGIEYDECAAEPGRWHVGFRAEVARIASGVALELAAVKRDRAARRRDNESDGDRAEGYETVAEHTFGPFEFKVTRDDNGSEDSDERPSGKRSPILEPTEYVILRVLANSPCAMVQSTIIDGISKWQGDPQPSTDPRTLRKHLQSLIEKGLVTKVGPRGGYAISDAGRKRVDSFDVDNHHA